MKAKERVEKTFTDIRIDLLAAANNIYNFSDEFSDKQRDLIVSYVDSVIKAKNQCFPESKEWSNEPPKEYGWYWRKTMVLGSVAEKKLVYIGTDHDDNLWVHEVGVKCSKKLRKIGYVFWIKADIAEPAN